MSVRVHKTLAILLLSGMAGCASGPFHRKSVPPPALQPQPPELSQTPLYSPEMSENNPRTPSLPNEQSAVVVPVKEPEPPPKKPHKTRKPKPSPAVPPKSASGDAEVASTGQTSAAPAAGVEVSPTVSERRSPEAQQAKAETPAASPIGELTTGDSAEITQTSHAASELIRTTREGMEGLKRTLSPAEKKTMVEIGTFLTRADQALKNGDVDGAYGLATKARILLDELTQN